jgi:hypothetical protein
MQVTFAFLSPEIASSRLRAEIPQRELEKLGVKKGRDILVYGKHVVPMRVVEQFGKRVYDICDDHFHTQHEAYYREHAAFADLVTVNSEEMARIVLEETGRKATVIIPDPYESEEQPAGYGKGVLWYGHESNLKTIEPYRDLIDRVLTHPEWSRENQVEAIKECAVVIIPTDCRKGKSANRLIEAVRNGRFVVAGDLPAHDEFKEFMWIGDIREGIEWAKSHKDECIERVKACQDYLRDRYSPERIGKLWLEALQGI